MIGKTVVVKRSGYTYSGVITSYSDWGTSEKPDRYIEFNSPTGKYHYCKEIIDGVDSIEIS